MVTSFGERNSLSLGPPPAWKENKHVHRGIQNFYKARCNAWSGAELLTSAAVGIAWFALPPSVNSIGVFEHTNPVAPSQCSEFPHFSAFRLQSPATAPDAFGIALNVSHFGFFFLKRRLISFSLWLGCLSARGRAFTPRQSNRLRWLQGFNLLVN